MFKIALHESKKKLFFGISIKITDQGLGVIVKVKKVMKNIENKNPNKIIGKNTKLTVRVKGNSDSLKKN